MHKLPRSFLVTATTLALSISISAGSAYCQSPGARQISDSVLASKLDAAKESAQLGKGDRQILLASPNVVPMNTTELGGSKALMFGKLPELL